MMRESMVNEQALPKVTVKSKKSDSMNLAIRRLKSNLAHWLFLISTLIGVVVLAVLLIDIVRKGLPWLSIDFLQSFASRIPENAGIKAGLWGSLWVLLITAPLSFVIGVATAIFLEEYRLTSKWGRRIQEFIQLNINNLAGVPSIVFGILGLTLFVRQMNLDKSVLAGALTLTLLILPIIVVACREAIASVPQSLRLASLAMGATRLQTIRKVVLPYAFPSILTGVILALSRAIGETAPLIMIGAVTYLAFTPESFMDMFTVMPIQIFNWISQPKEEFANLAAAGIIVLLVVLLSMNAVAIYLRNKYRRS
jgi:phosphate transport system permease protein